MTTTDPTTTTPAACVGCGKVPEPAPLPLHSALRLRDVSPSPRARVMAQLEVTGCELGQDEDADERETSVVVYLGPEDIAVLAAMLRRYERGGSPPTFTIAKCEPACPVHG